MLIGTDTSQTILDDYPPDTAAELVDIVSRGFVTGLRWALVFNAALAVAGVAVIVLRVGGPASRLGRDRGEDPSAPVAP